MVAEHLHPGEYLKEELVARDITQRAAALGIGVTESYVSDVIHGRRDVGKALAIRLSRFLGTSAGFWLHLQADYDTPIGDGAKEG